jgi:hypothetical protein
MLCSRRGYFETYAPYGSPAASSLSIPTNLV